MFEEYLQGATPPVLICWGEHLSAELYSKQMDGRGGRGCLTLGFKPAFSPSAALIWLHFLMLKMLTPFSFLLVKIILGGELCLQRVLLANAYVVISFFKF